jgi:type VI secretion system secreted protein VgrG
MPATQQHRLLSIETALGADALMIKDFSMTEELGRLFQIEVELASENASVDFNQVVGTQATVELELPDGSQRYFNGYISRFSQGERQRNYSSYRATLVPWLWLLTRTSDCRIFQKKTVPDILEEVFKGHGFNDFKPQLTGTYSQREYCVQYRETDFNFVSRLMEEEGIYYFFQHKDGGHTMVLTDSASKHEPFGSYSTINYKPRTHEKAEPTESITDWVIQKEVQPGAYVLADFNFTTPTAPIVVNDTVTRQHAQSSFEMFDYPGEYGVRGDGEGYAKLRIQEWQAQHELLRGQATCRGVSTGCKFTMKGHPRDDQNRDYVVTGASYHASVGGYETAAKGQGEEFFSCSFTAMPATEQFRPARVTPRPVIQGPQTAMVVGQSGQEVDTDEYGRVKVQFPWDRHGTSDQNSSCWIRVSQLWAGKGWGGMNIPRIKQEVIVEFLEGDPDRPIITGRVYNATATVPYKLPDNKTRSTILSNSSQGGQGFNELRFEDKKGSEQIYLHGEKNQDIRIKNDTKEWVGNDRHLTVKANQKEKVEGDQHGKVTGNQKLKVGGDHHCEVTGDHKSKIGGKQNQTITGDRVVEVDGADHLNAKGDRCVQVGGDTNLKGTGNWNVETGQKISINADGDFHEKAGQTYAMAAGTTIHIKGGTTVVIEAGTQLSLKAGSRFVDIGPSGVSIQGTMVNINSGGSPASGSGSSPTAPKAPNSPAAPDSPDDPTAPNDDNGSPSSSSSSSSGPSSGSAPSPSSSPGSTSAGSSPSAGSAPSPASGPSSTPSPAAVPTPSSGPSPSPGSS